MVQSDEFVPWQPVIVLYEEVHDHFHHRLELVAMQFLTQSTLGFAVLPAVAYIHNDL